VSREAGATAGNHPSEDRAPDLRLASFAVALWLAALASLYLSARWGLILGSATLAAAAGTALIHRIPRASDDSRREAVRWLVAAALLGAGCGAVATAARVSVRDAGPVAALVDAGATVRVDLVVRDDPRALRGSPGLPATYLVAVELTSVFPEDGSRLRLSVRALVLGSDPAWQPLLPGQRASVKGRLMAPRGGDLRAAVLSVKDAPLLHGRSSWTQRAAGTLRAGLQRACAPLPDDVGGLLPGLVVGDTSRLDDALEEDFRTTGMTHLNAVSGPNVP
jgi:competence protein ComEC